jgi:hypothetical protein
MKNIYVVETCLNGINNASHVSAVTKSKKAALEYIKNCGYEFYYDAKGDRYISDSLESYFIIHKATFEPKSKISIL